MKKIRISGEIGFEYTPQTIADDLRAANGEDLDIELATPGGDVFAGIEIFNALRDYRRDNPGAKINMIAKGVVASMGSYIFSAPADNRRAEDNAVFMVHNPYQLALGDYREMQRSAEFLAGLASIMADAYSAASGKTKADISALMDAETWLFGDEIKTAGFADEMIPGDGSTAEPKPAAKMKALASARLRFGAMVDAAQKRADAKANSQKAAAMLASSVQGASAPAVSFSPEEIARLLREPAAPSAPLAEASTGWAVGPSAPRSPTGWAPPAKAAAVPSVGEDGQGWAPSSPWAIGAEGATN